ncbi:putative T7SS-secreted protein [Austwickia chelonae]|uniref:putative T7SS-secreted protein n=1 Tax=Austwickia chelonae TaxID=100225 RepID=UPI000E25DA2B|nr:DUF6531 domain-containing protein [Austwickia chelonae]
MRDGEQVNFRIDGNPNGIRARASELRSQASVFDRIAVDLSIVATDGWTGRAADRFREKFTVEPQRWRDAADGFRRGASAAEVYADALAQAQSTAAACTSEYARGDEVTRQAQTSYQADVKAGQVKKAEWERVNGPGTFALTIEPFVDPGKVIREGAVSTFNDARRQLDEAAAACAMSMRAAAANAPERRNWLSQAGELAKGVGDSLMGILDLASMQNQQLRELAGVISGDMTFEELSAKYQLKFESTVSMLAYAKDHPVEFAKSVGSAALDLDTWGRNPARAAGRLVPDLVLTLATAGGGAAAKGAKAGQAGVKGLTQAAAEGTAARGSVNSMRDVAAAADGLGDLSRVSRRPELKTCRTDPIDVATGEVVLSCVDLQLPGVLPIRLERMHVSSYRRGRAFGASWSSSLDERIEVDAETGALAFYRADAVTLIYQAPLPGGRVMPVTGDRWPLEATVGGGYVVSDPATGVRREFSSPSFAGVAPDREGEPGAVVGYGLTAVVDGHGNRIDVDYADGALPTAWRHSGGYLVEFDRTDAGDRVAAIRVSRDGGRPVTVRRFGYDGDGHLVAEHVGDAAAATRFGYTPQGRLAWWLDRNGERYDYTYDDRGRCVAGSGSDGTLSSVLFYDDLFRETTFRDGNGHLWRFEHDGAGRVVRETDPLGGSTVIQWDSRGRRTAVVDPVGGVSTWRYDDDGNVVEAVGPGGRAATMTFVPGTARPIRVVEPDGAVWAYEWDRSGALAAVTDPAGGLTRVEHDAGTGATTAVTDATGRVTRWENDAAGMPVRVVDGAGRTREWSRDVFGRVVADRDAAGEWVAAYDVDGHVTWARDADGGQNRWEYDGEGNLLRRTDPLGLVTSWEYGRFDRPVARVAADGGRVEFEWDPERRLVAAVDPLGRSWRYEHDAAGRVVAQTDVNGARVFWSYDAAGRVIERVNGSGQRVAYSYDEFGDLIESVVDGPLGEAGASGVPRLTRWVHDAAGRLLSTAEASAGAEGVMVIGRDAAGRVVAEGWGESLVWSRLDAAGRVVARRAPSGAGTGFSYDAGGALTGLDVGGRSLSFALDGAGREMARVVDSGAVIQSEWTAAGRLAAVRSVVDSVTGVGVGIGRSYRYDGAGRLTGQSDAGGIREFDLDPMGRVVESRLTGRAAPEGRTGDGYSGDVYGGLHERFAYDATGALTAATSSGGFTGGENTDGGAVRASGVPERGAVRDRRAWHVEYDVDGRVTRRSRRTLSGKRLEWTYHWDGEDRLVQADGPDGLSVRYRYDPLGRRVHATTTRKETPTHTRRWAWSAWDVIEETTTIISPEGVTTSSLTWDRHPDTGIPLAQRHHTETGEDAPRTLRPQTEQGQGCPVDGWTQERVDGEFAAIVTDLAGSPTELLTTTGQVTWQRHTTLWGQPLNPNPSHTPTTETPHCPLGSLGQIWDQDIGWYYNHHRWYDPTHATFTTPDPTGLPGGINPHTPVPNPLTWTDPHGLTPGKCPTNTTTGITPPAAKGVSSSGIRFSQSSVNGAAEIEASMRANGWVGDAIDVVRMNDGGLTSLDNTRLLAAKRAGIDVRANVHGFDDALPARMVERFTTVKGGVPTTWGDAVMNRIGGQSAGYRGANPLGSWVTGWSGN